MRKTYDIRQDAERIARIRASERSTTGLGLSPAQAPFGSPEWWAAIDDGRIPLYTVHGVISRLYVSGLPSPDWPEFEIDAEGERSSWPRMTSDGPPGSPTRLARDALYELGRPVLLKYVRQRLRHELPGKAFIKTVLEIWIGGTDARRNHDAG
ncbi:MAG TPA: hypothetical protein VGR59_07500 [Gemmatimonadaceae bacterium]|nr:hypothetical protein [Gemmatimonadaceae bacterium]